MARHITGNAKLAETNAIITPEKKSQGCDKDSSIRITSHKQQRSTEIDGDQHDASNDKSKILNLRIVC